MASQIVVILAKAGIQELVRILNACPRPVGEWIPAFAVMTNKGKMMTFYKSINIKKTGVFN
jgi:hypothetical protein